MSKRKIELNIEELRLVGFPASQGRGIRDAFQQELARLVERQGLPPAWTPGEPIESLGSAQFKLRGGESPAAAGVRAAQAVYGGQKK